MSPINSVIPIEVFESSETAPDYKKGNWKPAKILKCAIVCNGTVGGDNTIDIQFEDMNGNKYVTMLSAKLLNTINTMAQVKPVNTNKTKH